MAKDKKLNLKGHLQSMTWGLLAVPHTLHPQRPVPAENSGIHSPPSTSAHTHVPDTSTNLCNAESVKQRTPHLLFKKYFVTKGKKIQCSIKDWQCHQVYYTIFNLSERQTNHQQQGDGAMAFLRVGFLSFCYQEIKLKIVSLSKNKTKYREKKNSPGKRLFWYSTYIFFAVNCHLTWFSLH